MSRPFVLRRRWLGLPVLVVSLSLLVASSAHADYKFVKKWGSNDPSGISIASDTVYVGDFNNGIVRAFSETGAFQYGWGTGSGTGYDAHDVAVTGNSAYVAEPACCSDDSIDKFTATTGAFLGSFGPSGSGQGELHAPLGVATNANGTLVYVADTGNDRIQVFTSAGNWIDAWGSSGGLQGRFYSPTGIAVARNGNVYVADEGNNRIQEFTSGGEFIRKWSVGSNSDPYAVAVDSHGFVYVVDDGLNAILKFTATGAFLESIAQGSLDNPSDVAIDANDNVYMTNTGTSQIQKWAFIKQPPHSLIAPKINGQPHLGSTLTCDKGVWSGSLPITYTYRWLRSGSPIAGATSARYAPKSADKGKYLKCEVTAKNAYGGPVTKQSASVKVT